MIWNLNIPETLITANFSGILLLKSKLTKRLIFARNHFKVNVIYKAVSNFYGMWLYAICENIAGTSCDGGYKKRQIT